MSELRKLLEGLKVEWKTLGEVAELKRGRVMSKNYFSENSGIYPVYSSQTANNGEIGKINTYDFSGEYLTWTTDGAKAGTIFYRNGNFSITNVCGLIKIKADNPVDYKFLFYWLNIRAKDHVYYGMGNPKLMSHQIEKIPIPIPCPDNPEKSLKIQEEIVRILDSLSEETNQLTAALQKELNLHQKQYNYYREELFKFKGKEVEWKSLGNIANIYDGTHQTPKYIDKGIPFVSVQNIKNLYATNKYISVEDFEKYKYKPQKGDIFMTRIGSIGSCAIVENDDPLAYYVTLTLIRVNHDIVTSKYLKHLIESNIGQRELLKRTLVNATPIKINLGEIGKIKIPIPCPENPVKSQKIQNEIVSVLDEMDTKTQAITSAIQKEIALRNKQYEYYRHRLLSFQSLQTEAEIIQ